MSRIDSKVDQQMTDLPKAGLYRAAPGFELRDDAEVAPRLTGYPIRFNEATTIDSLYEGRFIERIAPGSTKKTLAENKGLRILFEHGHHPQVGESPIAEPHLIEDSRGVRYDEPELFDGLPDLVLSGLRAGQYGSSFKFSVLQEELNRKPDESADNPDRLPERTITEMKVYEAGPVTFPAYEGATAGIRSLTDRFTDQLRSYSPEELDELFHRWVEKDPERANAILKGAEVIAAEDAPTLPEVTHPEKAETSPHSHGGRNALAVSISGQPTRALDKSLDD